MLLFCVRLNFIVVLIDNFEGSKKQDEQRELIFFLKAEQKCNEFPPSCSLFLMNIV